MAGKVGRRHARRSSLGLGSEACGASRGSRREREASMWSCQGHRLPPPAAASSVTYGLTCGGGTSGGGLWRRGCVGVA
ncbi:hypothetical protein E2562_005871 [Oryza meyeriana var. granulata]|uniref:Uncharacterized protein n=1 Tax=Oryza meyeriana var. granulata TaxID=110450 RepID=A0A6G1DVM6_9ORYZ|nr:hypothetical protein E2562_005871 [Oryza meyeriana var. granulata]